MVRVCQRGLQYQACMLRQYHLLHRQLCVGRLNVYGGIWYGNCTVFPEVDHFPCTIWFTTVNCDVNSNVIIRGVSIAIATTWVYNRRYSLTLTSLLMTTSSTWPCMSVASIPYCTRPRASSGKLASIDIGWFVKMEIKDTGKNDFLWYYNLMVFVGRPLVKNRCFFGGWWLGPVYYTQYKLCIASTDRTVHMVKLCEDIVAEENLFLTPGPCSHDSSKHHVDPVLWCNEVADRQWLYRATNQGH